MKKLWIPIYLLMLATVLSCPAAEKKNNMTVRDAQKALKRIRNARVKKQFRMSKLGSLEVGETFYHIFSSNIPPGGRRLYRTLIFDNNARLVGFYETEDEPLETDGASIVFASGFEDTVRDISDEEQLGDEWDEEINYYPNVIEFTRYGPPDTVNLDEGTIRLIRFKKRAAPSYYVF